MAIPAGVIFPYNGTHASVAGLSGWDRATDYDDRYPLGAADGENGGATGGSATHTHETSGHTHTVSSHSHSGGTSGNPSVELGSFGSGTTLADNVHTHSVPTTGSQTATLASQSTTTTAGSSLPPSYEVIWIESDGTPAGIPVGGWALYADSSLPLDWTAQSAPAGRYLKGAAVGADAGGTTGGTHTHSGAPHTHAIGDHLHAGGASGAPLESGNTGTTNSNGSTLQTHTHPLSVASTPTSTTSGSATSGASGASSSAPAYAALAVIQNGSGAASAPAGIIGMWPGTVASIPENWVLCDGANGTPDLRDKMIVGAAADLSDLGTSSGTTTHDHTAPSEHSHAATHTHTISIGATAAVAGNTFGSANAGGTHTHPDITSGSGGGTSGGSTETISSTMAYPPYTTVLWIQLQSFPQTASPDPIVVEVGIPAQTLVHGVAVRSPDPLTVEVGIVAPAALAGEVTATPIPVEVSVDITTPHLVGSQIVVDPDPLVVAVGSVAPTLVHQYTAQPAPVPVDLTIVPPTLAHLLTAQPDTVRVELGIVTPTLLHGEATAQPDPLTVAVAVVPPTLARVYTAEPDPLVVALTIPPPTAFLFGTAKPPPLVVEVPLVTPALVMGEKRMVVDPLAIDVTIPEPTVRLLYTVTPPPLEVEIALLAPTLIPGEVRYTPDPLVVEVGIPDPTVGLIYTVAPAPIVVEVIIPDPRLGNVVGLRPVPVITPTAAQVEAALSGQRGGVNLRFRYTRRTRTNGFIDEIFAVARPGTITLDNTRAVVRDIDVVFNRSLLPSDFNASNDIIGVAVEVYVPPARQWVSMPAGLFVLDSNERLNRATRDIIPAKGADLAMLLVRSVRTAAYTVPQGTNYVQAVQEIIARHGLAYSIAPSPLSTSLDLTWGPGTTDYQITRDLLFGINYYPLWADATGRLRSRERIDPATETAAVTYRDTAEPRLVSGDDDVRIATDRKPLNRAVVVIDDPRHDDYGYALRENADPSAPNSTAALAYGTAVAIATSSADSPSVITTATAHGFSTGVQVLVSGHTGSTPSINGSHIVEVLSPTTFSIPVAVSVAGSGGTVQATTVQQEAWDGDSTPPTKAIADMATAEAIAEAELRWAAIGAQPMELPTFIDPRRDAREFYRVDLDGVEDSQLYAVLGWSMTLEPGQIMRHQLGRVVELELLSPPKG